MGENQFFYELQTENSITFYFQRAHKMHFGVLENPFLGHVPPVIIRPCDSVWVRQTTCCHIGQTETFNNTAFVHERSQYAK